MHASRNKVLPTYDITLKSPCMDTEDFQFRKKINLRSYFCDGK